ncbi:MAG: helix-turn-helix domain-containing protein [Oscillospiraceae bacterium]|nr:helix-turn-helix domain-containing protein [Oscillospiraceae bacterium]
MENPNYAQILSERILSLRKEKSLTQEALAQQLGVSFQAVSKWENEQSCPDIALLPQLAEIFEVTIDSLFGRQAPEAPPAEAPPAPVIIEEPVFATGFDLPWPDDQTLRGVVYWGRKLLCHDHIPKRKFTFNASDYTWILRYSPLNVAAECGIQVEGNIQRNATAGSHIHCNDIGGSATAGSHIHCNDVSASAGAGSHIQCNDVGGDANAGSHIECGNVGGNVRAMKVTMKR